MNAAGTGVANIWGSESYLGVILHLGAFGHEADILDCHNLGGGAIGIQWVEASYVEHSS